MSDCSALNGLSQLIDEQLANFSCIFNGNVLSASRLSTTHNFVVSITENANGVTETILVYRNSYYTPLYMLIFTPRRYAIARY